MFALLLCLRAEAAVNQVGLERMMLEIAPRMRTLTSAALNPLPDARVEDRAALLERQKATRSANAYAAFEEALVDGVLALYDPEAKQIVVVADSFSAALTSAAVPREQVDAAVKCVLAHELVHAAQHERRLAAGRVETASHPSGALLAVLEGQADMLSGPICPVAIREPVRAMHGVDVLASREPDGTVFTYGYGERFVQAWEAHQGSGATWSLLERLEGPNPPAFTRADVESVALEGLPVGWRGWTGLEEAARALFPAMLVPAAVATSPYTFVGPDRNIQALAGLGVKVSSVAGGPAAGADDEATAGTAAQNSGVGDAIAVYAWAMADPTMARLWVELRRGAMNGQTRFLAMLPFGEGSFGPPTAPAVKIAGAENQVRLRVNGRGWSYEEVWASRGSTLVGVVTRSDQRVDATGVVGTLLAGPPLSPPGQEEPAADQSAAVFARLAAGVVVP